MFFGLFGNNKNHTRYTAVFDIANGSVGAALVALHTNDQPEILFTTRIPLPYETGTREVLPGLTEALTKASTNILSAMRTALPAGETFDIRVFAHAPWCATTTQRVPLPFTRETTITKKLLNTMLARVLQDVEPKGMKCIDRKVLQIALNGYVVENPVGKRAQSAHVTVVRSFIEARIAEIIHTVLGSQFAGRTVEIDAFVFSLVQFQSLWKNAPNATLIDVGGLYSAVTIVRSGTVFETHTIPVGHRTTLAALGGLYTDSAQVTSQLQLYFSNTATPSQTQKIEDALSAQEGSIIRALGDGFTEIVQQHGKVPSHVLLSVGTPLAPWFEKLLTKIDFAQFTTTAKPFDVSLLSTTLIKEHVRTRPGSVSDPMLSLAVHLLSAS